MQCEFRLSRPAIVFLFAATPAVYCMAVSTQTHLPDAVAHLFGARSMHLGRSCEHCKRKP